MENRVQTLDGLIRKGVGGFYTVEAAGAAYVCRARGALRKKRQSPLAGDHVRITVTDGRSENTIDEIYPRKNALLRPPVANIDTLVIVVSTSVPRPSAFLIDKLTALAEYKRMEPAVVFTKTDEEPADALASIYREAGIATFCVSNTTGQGIDGVRAWLCGKISAFTGNSGVGKTSLLNRLAPELSLETGEVSEKLGRGRHTTRQAELFQACGGYIVDTPGFSALDLERAEWIPKDELASCFREFRPYLDGCKFTSCSHTCDKGCGVLAALEAGKIAVSRHQSYVQLYNEVKDKKEWET